MPITYAKDAKDLREKRRNNPNWEDVVLKPIKTCRPYAPDWEQINPDTQYSKSRDLWWHKGVAYDRLSASHNGIIGAGAQLKAVIKRENQPNETDSSG